MEGRASFFYKPVGANKTFGVTGDVARDRLLKQLRCRNSAFIYHCFNHYCCPIGFEREPTDKKLVYSDNQNERSEFIDWIFIADTSRKYPSFHCVRWYDIEADLQTRSPEFMNIRHLERGVESRAKLAVDVDEQAAAASKPREDDFDDREAAKFGFRKTFSKERNLHCIMKFESFLTRSRNNFPECAIFEKM